MQLLRHLGLAARFVSGYLIQLKRRREVARRPVRHRGRLHRPARLVRGLPARRRLDRPRSDLRPARRRRPHPARLHARARRRPRRSPARSTSARSTFAHQHVGARASAKRRASPSPTPTSSGRRSTRSATGSTPTCARGDVRLTHGRRADVRLDRRPRRRRVEHRRRSGPTKRLLSAELLDRLRAQFAPGGLLHFGQGKWYPGEPLPRWALACYWRKDGEPIWHDPALFADEHADYGATAASARRVPAPRWPTRLGRRSATTSSRPTRTPGTTCGASAGCRPTSIRSTRASPIRMERDAAAPGLRAQGSDSVGRLRAAARRDERRPATRWRSGPWFLRDERCYLIPGDSPMGYRLPLDSLPWAAPDDLPVAASRPTRSQPLRAAADARSAARAIAGAQRRRVGATRRAASAASAGQRERDAGARSATPATRAAARFESAACVTRTALVRRAARRPAVRLHAAGGDARGLPRPRRRRRGHGAPSCSCRSLLEGYAPPRDPRLQRAARHARPRRDRGQHPPGARAGTSWSSTPRILYEEARADAARRPRSSCSTAATPAPAAATTSCSAAPTPADTPFLRRPDLLAQPGRLLAQPSVAVATCSRACSSARPARRRASTRRATTRVYELEIAFARAGPQHGRPATSPPWLVDRLFRNLLIDVTGNTHRAEFCIDKLYSPDGPTGRLGLLEMRAFEMPPHARMSLAQQLLLRALVARFWDEPVPAATLVRWGTELHDRFMLPHFVWQDFARRPRRPARTPAIRSSPTGSRRTSSSASRCSATSPPRGVELELRTALEPWHVLGEESGGRRHGALRRFVGRAPAGQGDRAWSATATCSPATAARVPLQPTGTRRRVRRRRALPRLAAAVGLHPTIGVHAPLVFDLVDTWMGRSLGGCPYHVAHPGGRNYDDLPGQRPRGRGAAARALLPHRPHAGPDDGAARSAATRTSRSRSTCAGRARRRAVRTRCSPCRVAVGRRRC